MIFWGNTPETWDTYSQSLFDIEPHSSAYPEEFPFSQKGKLAPLTMQPTSNKLHTENNRVAYAILKTQSFKLMLNIAKSGPILQTRNETGSGFGRLRVRLKRPKANGMESNFLKLLSIEGTVSVSELWEPYLGILFTHTNILAARALHNILKIIFYGMVFYVEEWGVCFSTQVICGEFMIFNFCRKIDIFLCTLSEGVMKKSTLCTLRINRSITDRLFFKTSKHSKLRRAKYFGIEGPRVLISQRGEGKVPTTSQDISAPSVTGQKLLIGVTGVVDNKLQKYPDRIPGQYDIYNLQRSAILGTAHILWKSEVESVLEYCCMDFFSDVVVARDWYIYQEAPSSVLLLDDYVWLVAGDACANLLGSVSDWQDVNVGTESLFYKHSNSFEFMNRGYSKRKSLSQQVIHKSWGYDMTDKNDCGKELCAGKGG
ncbi:hypothetical protein GQR58_018941 [Nymphon striatum]|nr:hypothetical protein GQR58_018941 [Nymphon striatum]